MKGKIFDHTKSTMLIDDMVYVNMNMDRYLFDPNPDLMEKKRDHLKRSELKSTHGDTAELYDQFYRDHQLLLKLFVLLGVMPVVRSAPGVVTFRWSSIQSIYAIVLYIFTTSLVLRIGYERVKILLTIEEFDEYVYAIIFILFLVPHFWIPYVGWGVAQQVAAYKTMWGSFQVRYYRVTGTTLQFPILNLLITVMFIGCVLLSIIFLYSLSRLLDGFLLWHTSAYFHIITMINMNAALFYINCRAIKTSANSLARDFKRDVKMNTTCEMIAQYRLLWLDLSDILQSFGNAYSRTYSTYCLFMSINITIGSYGSFSEVFDSGFSTKVIGLIVLTIYCATLLAIICDCAESATTSVAQGVQDTLLSIDLLRVEIQTHREIDHFVSAIELNPPVIDMQGWGLINRELLTDTTSTIAIYLIILLQFKLSIIAQKAWQEAHQL